MLRLRWEKGKGGGMAGRIDWRRIGMAVMLKNTVGRARRSGLPKLRNWVLDERLAIAELLGPEARLAKAQPSPGRAG